MRTYINIRTKGSRQKTELNPTDLITSVQCEQSIYVLESVVFRGLRGPSSGFGIEEQTDERTLVWIYIALTILPANTQRRINVVTTSLQRRGVAATL